MKLKVISIDNNRKHRVPTSSLSSSRRSGSRTGLSGTSGSLLGGNDSGRKTLSPAFFGALRKMHLVGDLVSLVVSLLATSTASKHLPLTIFLALASQVLADRVPKSSLELSMSVDAKDAENYMGLLPMANHPEPFTKNNTLSVNLVVHVSTR